VNARRRDLALSLSIAAAAVVLHLFGDGVHTALRYDRAGLLSGEVWRALTAHIVHVSWGHTATNAIAALLIGALLPRERWSWLVAALGVTAGILAFERNVPTYAGLSGALHGVFAAGALRRFTKGDRLWGLGVAGLAIKLAYELWWGALPGSEAVAGAPVLVEAHLYGAMAGVGVYLVGAVRTR